MSTICITSECDTSISDAGSRSVDVGAVDVEAIDVEAIGKAEFRIAVDATHGVEVMRDVDTTYDVNVTHSVEVGDVDIITDEGMADVETTDVKVFGIVFTWLVLVTKTPNTFLISVTVPCKSKTFSLSHHTSNPK